MISILHQAIRHKRVVKINYEGHERIVEPHLVGRKKGTANVALSAWQIRGFSESNTQPPWRNYTLDKIEKITVLDESFVGSRPGYNPNDSTMSEIFHRL